MVVGINLLFLIPGKVGGTETYSRELVKALAIDKSDNHYVVFVNKEASNWELPENSKILKVICPVAASNRLNRYLFEQFYFPFLLGSYKVEVLHSFGYVGPLITFCKHVVTIPDINFVGHGSSMPRRIRILLGFMVKATAICSNKIITISEFSRSEILKYLNVTKEKVRVIHLASFIDGNIAKSIVTYDRFETQRIRQKFNTGDNYLLAFSSLNAHKNIPALVLAYANIQKKTNCKLVLVGNILNTDLIHRLIDENKMQDFISVTGYVSDLEIANLLSGARLFIFPSFYEGFGLPLLEAQSVGTCVICSDRGSLPEIGSDSVEYFDPSSIENMSKNILQLLNTPIRIAELQKKGFENVKHFSWTRTATETLAVYQLL